MIDSSWRTFYTRFGSSQPPVSFEITTIASLTAIIPKKVSLVLLIKYLPHSGYLILNEIRSEIASYCCKVAFFDKESFLFQVGKFFCNSTSFLICRDTSTRFRINWFPTFGQNLKQYIIGRKQFFHQKF